MGALSHSATRETGARIQNTDVESGKRSDKEQA